MRAVVCRAYGHWRDMRVEEVPAPALGPGQARIKVEAAGVSFANALVVAGKHQNRPQPPFIPGTEIAGVVTEVAHDVTACRPGERVCAGLPWGGWAEEACLDALNVHAIPPSMSFAQATHVPTIYATGWIGLTWRAGLKPGETLLVLGAAGGVGLSAVELGKALGARVIAAAGSADKLAVCAAHGADDLVNYRREDLRERVLALTGGRGADVIYDPVGGDAFDASLRCIAPEGRLLVIGFAEGRIPQAPANLLLLKNASAVGLYLGWYTAWGKSRAPLPVRLRFRQAMQDLLALYDKGAIRPRMAGELPLNRFADALDRIAARDVIGKLALLPAR
jgi:NADPH2:quinone reductase